MTRFQRVGTVAVVLALVAASPSPALAQRGGESWWDMIKELSGPRLHGIGVTAIEVCVSGLVLGKQRAECPDDIRRRRLLAQETLKESLTTYLLSFPVEGRSAEASAPAESVQRQQTAAGGEGVIRNPQVIQELVVELIGSLIPDPAAAVQQAIQRQPEVIGRIAAVAQRARELARRDEEGGRKPAYTRREVAKLAFQIALASEAASFVRASVAAAEVGPPQGAQQGASVSVAERRQAALEMTAARAREILDRAYSEKTDPDSQRVFHTFLRLNTGWSTGTAEDQGGSDNVNRWLLSPTFSLELESTEWVTAYGDAALSFNRFYGEGFESFWRHSFDGGVGVRFGRPKDLVYVDVGMRVRYFPTPFTSQDFGGPEEPVPNGGEWAWSPIAIGVGFQIPTLSF